MATLNPNFSKLAAGYLFPEVSRRVERFLEEHAGVEVMKLGIGDTTEPLTDEAVSGLHFGVNQLARRDTYKGYGPEQGRRDLREAVSGYYAQLGAEIDPDEIFISDGAKPDSANIQELFGPNDVVGVQDPAYPVYVDSNVFAGRTGGFKDGRYKGLVYLPCTPENGFFPVFPKDERIDLLYICSPNNPTGAVATHANLDSTVDFAIKGGTIVIDDTTYEPFIRDGSPRTIYTTPGAKRCAIEINSWSKSNGFTGVRLGWTVVPKELVLGKPGELNAMWNRRQSTKFNGASFISQEGGLAALSEEGHVQSKELVDYYLGNAAIIKQGVQSLGLTAYGGENAPYIWMATPNGMPSWTFFDKLLREAHVVGTPGAGFGPSGEGFLRLSAFGHRENIEKAIESMNTNLRL